VFDLVLSTNDELNAELSQGLEERRSKRRTEMSGLHITLNLMGVLIIIATVLPLSRSHRWWVRICDFPRFQVAVLAIGLLVLLVATCWPFGILDYVLFTGVALSALWQVSWVWRYIPGAPLEVESRYTAVGAPERIALLTTNVLQKSRDSDALLKIIAEADPDLVLAVETDEWWCTRLTEGIRARYPHSLIYPLSNGYGLAAFSRLELTDPAIRFLVDDSHP
jgi:endonuclease/exonuclease/phosphatase (EEP) superfamily protein YafD